MNPFIATPSQRPAVIAEVEKRLAANPKIAAEFDGLNKASRREKIVACLDFIAATKSENAALKASVAAKKAKLASLAGIASTNERLKKELASAKSRRGAIIAQATKPAPKPAAPAPVAEQSIATLKRGETLSGRRYCKPTPTTTSPNRPRI